VTGTLPAARAAVRLRIGAGLLGAVGVFFAVAPLAVFTTGYGLDVARLAFYLAILACTWSLLAGVAGQFSFAHVAIAGLAGYSGAIWSRRMFADLDWVAGAAGSIAVGTAFGLAVGTALGLLTLRLRGAYFALFTIAFAEVARLVIIAESDLTGGRLSMPVFPQLPGSDTAHYYALLGLLLATLAAVYVLLHSRIGLNLHAMREDPDAAEAMGVNVSALKLQVIAVTSLLVSFAGAVYFHTTPRMVPENLDLILMSQVIAFAIIGGLEHPLAAALSAVLLTFLMENLRTVSLAGRQIELLAMGLIAAAMMNFLWPVLRGTGTGWLSVAGRHLVAWLAPGLLLAGWWLFAPVAAGGYHSTAGWAVAGGAVALIVAGGAGLHRADLSPAARRAAIALGLVPLAVLLAAKLIAVGQIHLQLGVWRLAVFGAVLVATLRFIPNGLFLPVFDYFTSRAALRTLAVRHRDHPGDGRPASEPEPATDRAAP